MPHGFAPVHTDYRGVTIQRCWYRTSAAPQTGPEKFAPVIAHQAGGSKRARPMGWVVQSRTLSTLSSFFPCMDPLLGSGRNPSPRVSCNYGSTASVGVRSEERRVGEAGR